MDFAPINFVKSCVTSYEYASSSLATTTERCYSSAVALNEIIGIVVLFLVSMGVAIYLFRKK
jgi:hypothetical protein